MRPVWSYTYTVDIYALNMDIVCKFATNIIYTESVSNIFFKTIKQSSNINRNECLGLEICAIGE